MVPLLSTLLGLAFSAAPGPEIVPPALLAPLALPEALPARRDVATTITVRVTIDVDGTAREASVVDGPGVATDPAFARIVLDALALARFRPATRAGAPIAVRVEVPIALGGARKIVEPRFDRREPEPTPVDARGIVGVVLERGTRRPVPGVAVTLDDGRETLTDADGRFAFRDLPRGRYRVEVPFFDQDDTRQDVSVPGSVVLRVMPEALRDYRTRVVGTRSGVTDAARVVVPVERAREVPGSSGDPLKVLETLPGVARPAAAGPGAGEIAVRGSAPEDTRIYLEGLPLFQLYHFGNVYSVLQDAWIQDIDFRAGGFSTSFGDAIGGLVDLSLADLEQDGAHGYADVNVYHVASLVTVPLSKDWTTGAAFRRSWIDAIIGGIAGDGVSFSTAPRYYDYQVRADYLPSSDTGLRLIALGSDDEVVVLGSEPGANDPAGGGFSLARFFHQVQGTLDLALAPDLGLRIGLATSYQQLRLSPGADQDFTLTFDPATLRADLDYRPSDAVRVRGGLWADATRFRVDLALPRPTKEGQVQLPSEVLELFTTTEDGFSGRLDGWGEASVRVLPEVTLLGGLRLASWHGNFSAFAPDVRLAAGWRPSDASELVLTGGLNHQAPQPDESARSIGSTTLAPERAGYLNLGFEQRLADVLSIELQAFWKTLDQLVVPTGSRNGEPYDNTGTGTIIGAEAFLRLQHPVVDGWLAYTLSRSRRVDRPGEPERFFSFDQTHVLALVVGVQLGAGWRAGGRLRYATGNPFTPLEPAYFDAGADVWIPRAAGEPLSERSAPFFQLDLRVDKTFVFDSWRLDLYFEVNNATDRANIEAIRYADDYRRRDDITSLRLTPSLGVRGSF